MKLNILSVLLLSAISLLYSCDKDPDEPIIPEPPSEMAERTVVAYVMGDNSLSYFSSIDLKEMLKGIAVVDTKINNLLVYIDRNGSSKQPLEPQLIRLCRNTNNEVILDTVYTYDARRNSAGGVEVKEVLAYAFNRFRAKSYGFVLWSHGDGWLPFEKNVNTRWIGQDTDTSTKDKRLNIDDLHTALQDLPKLDYLFFDACYMSSIEVAYELRDCADYFIGSPTEIPGPGAPYDEVVPALFALNDAPLAIATAYYDYYARFYTNGEGLSNDNWTGGVSISILKADGLKALADATRQLPLYTSDFINLNKAKCYDPLRSLNYYDFNDIAKLVADSDQSLYQYWKQAYNATMVYAQTTAMNYNTYTSGYGKMVSMEGFTGASIYVLAQRGNTNQKAYYKQLEWYKDTAQ